MILHEQGKEALVNAVTNPNYNFPELREIFILNQDGAAGISPNCSMEKVLSVELS